MRMNLAKGMAALVMGALVILGCGDESDPYEDADPRCAAACAIEEPPIEGALDICSQESARGCLGQCAARIEAVTPLCATCLTEGAALGTEDGDGFYGSCDPSGYCWLENELGQRCEYAIDQQAAKEACIRQLYPRREVACTASWRPVTECAAICGGASE